MQGDRDYGKQYRYEEVGIAVSIFVDTRELSPLKFRQAVRQ
jgi:hypothetical protein